MKRARMKSLRHRSGLLWIVNLILIFGLVLTFGCSSEREDSVQQDSALRGPRAHDQAGNTLDEGEKTSRDRVDTSRDQLLDQSEMPPRDDADSAVVPVGDLADSSRSELIEYSESRAELGDLESASSALQIALLRDPADVEILFRLAGLRASVGEFSEAIDLLDGIPMNHPEAGLAALGQKADWCLQLQRYDRAEEHYREVLSRVPDAAMAHRQLSRLLNQQGRRHEAAIHIRELCRLGDVRQEELQSLIVLGDAMASDLPSFDASNPLHEGWLASARGRALLTEKRYSESAATIRPVLERRNVRPAVWALYGLAVAEAQDDEAFRWWLSSIERSSELSEAMPAFPEYWTALGVMFADQRQVNLAIGALLRAVTLDQTDFRAVNRLIRMFDLLEDQDSVSRWEVRWRECREILRASNAIANSVSADPEQMDLLSQRLMDSGRKLEATLWGYLADYHRSAPPQTLAAWNAQRQSLLSEGGSFPSVESLVSKRDLASYPAPGSVALKQLLGESVTSVDPRGNDMVADVGSVPVFRNVAKSLGITHVYEVANEPTESGFRMHQQLGGGVAVADLDRDGLADLYFAQGRWSDDANASGGRDQLYRNLGGRFVLLRGDSNDPKQHTIGCTAGDWNQDGFPDIVTTGMKYDCLLLNNGDGTYTKSTIEASSRVNQVPASVAIADLNQSGLPDLYRVNYVEDEELFRKPPVNEVGEVIEALGPNGFGHSRDQIALNDGSGGLNWLDIGGKSQAARPGLGLVIANLDGHQGNEVFVGNDSTANQCWKYSVDKERFVDTAKLMGLAFSAGGAGTASMGIAAEDFDNNGGLDFHIANFQQEPVCLYLQDSGGYRDRAKQFGLGSVSLPVLGFGAQAIDFNNDGLADLAVSNGHVDEYLQMDGDFRQLPQLFANRGGRLVLSEAAVDSSYWATPHLGRAMAKLDVNRDGRMDLVVTHLNEASALLMNETITPNHWVQFEFVGTESGRDAVGVRVEASIAGKLRYGWVTAGDGYLCRNESIIAMGIGEDEVVDELVVWWPSGRRQQFGSMKADCRYLITEGQDLPHQLW